MSRNWITAAVIVALLAHANLRAEPPAKEAPPAEVKQFVTVEVTVLEVNRTKLRAVGFDWDLVSDRLRPNEADPKRHSVSANQLEGFVKALNQYEMGKVVSQPKLMTLSGRPASLAVGTTKLDIVPIVLGSGRISVEHRLELPHAGGVFRSHSAVEVEPGQSVVVGNLRSEKKNAAGKTQEVETLVIVRADTDTKAR